MATTSSEQRFEVSPWSATFAEWAIDGFCDSWAEWQEEGTVPASERVPRVEVYHSARIGWVELQGDPRLGGTFRLLCGPHGARELIEKIQIARDQQKATSEDGPAAAKEWRSMMAGARALERKLEGFAAEGGAP